MLSRALASHPCRAAHVIVVGNFLVSPDPNFRVSVSNELGAIALENGLKMKVRSCGNGLGGKLV